MLWKKSFAFEKTGPKRLEISRPLIAPIWARSKYQYTISVDGNPIGTVQLQNKWNKVLRLPDNSLLEIYTHGQHFFIRRNGNLLPRAFNPNISFNIALLLIFLIGLGGITIGSIFQTGLEIYLITFGVAIIFLGIWAKSSTSPVAIGIVIIFWFAPPFLSLFFMNFLTAAYVGGLISRHPLVFIIGVALWSLFAGYILSKGYIAASLLQASERLVTPANPPTTDTAPSNTESDDTKIENQLRKLQSLQTQGLITEAEYEEKRKEILAKI